MQGAATSVAREVVQLEVEASVATIWLNRPHAANSIDLEMVRELRRIVYDIGARADIRVVVLRGRGRQFCAGGDMSMFLSQLETVGRYIRDVIADFHATILAFRDLPQPVVAVVHGAVAGGGLSLALACDFVIAGEGAKFATAYRKIGASPDGGMSLLLSRILGPRKALELMLVGETFMASEARSLGLVNRVVADAALDAEATSFCGVLARNSRASNACVKRLVNAAPTASFEEQLSREMEGFCALAAGADFSEGVTAFVARRTPNFE
ncbi:enoyl-CoA hydratase/isomerase family protein [Rhodococcus sp. MSC1_016]|jgi:2-(1,2-epoxy-1,2-dihydrophenyl)acetyl-CoA isomerase|uniref:enoyl-CoA hydratase/isomerase family protein n=1 Tax=Rhodococcus sp. MSC1_016 TaxID=2909266 RepID=UPI00202F2459|nr:enoyl-CoA hydratase-related protein [Rhodococcus sp. MSC1_016]